MKTYQVRINYRQGGILNKMSMKERLNMVTRCNKHQDQPTGQRGCMVCIKCGEQASKHE